VHRDPRTEEDSEEATAYDVPERSAPIRIITEGGLKSVESVDGCGLSTDRGCTGGCENEEKDNHSGSEVRRGGVKMERREMAALLRGELLQVCLVSSCNVACSSK
jgi:hypothetical protein